MAPSDSSTSPSEPAARRRMIRLAAGTAAATLLVPVAALAGTTGAGAEGVGDPYFPDYGNGGYDVSHIAVDVEVAGQTVSGTTTLTANATQRLTRFNLDFVLDTTSVTVNGQSASLAKPSVHELVVTPATAIENGAEMTVVVTYSDQPGSVSDGGINPVYTSGANGLTVIGEPESAPWWFPSNDHPQDKATYDIAITVPDGVEAISAGRLMGKDDAGAKDTWRWRVSQPTTGYLVFLATGQYDITRSRVEGRPTVTAIGADTGAAGNRAEQDFARLDEVIAFLESQFGDYHFNAHGNVVSNANLPFALETQTRPVYTPGFWFGGSNISVVVHEQAHQWWGDNVSVHNWRDIWLNEGFATWAQWRWEEDQGGATANETFASYYYGIPASDPYWNLTIGDPGANQLFAGQVYDRGAMTVQALRNRIGNADLLTVFAKYQHRHEFDDSGIRRFEKLAANVSGEDLDTFFDAWLYTSKRPPATAEFGVPPQVASSVEAAASIDRVRAATEMIVDAEAAAHGR